ncbi:MAG: hypothetical protein ACFFBP_13355 [Promethearchaeota archaeon]
MTKKRYECSECGFLFPSELSSLIDERTQVYCERCGTPFSIKGVVFKPYSSPKTETPTEKSKSGASPMPIYQKPKPRVGREEIKFQYKVTEKDKETINKFIQFLNILTSIPLYAISFYILGFLLFDVIMFIFFRPPYTPMLEVHVINFIGKGISGFGALFIASYDAFYISKKVKEKKYNEIAVDAICWGILGCIYFGIGVPLLLKGIAVFIYNLVQRKNVAHNVKNSLNHFSALAGIVIGILAISFTLQNILNFQDYVYFIGPEITVRFFGFIRTIKFSQFILSIIVIATMGIIILIIDLVMRKQINQKDKIGIGDAISVLIIGIIGVASVVIGIFILLKGALLFLMIIFQPKKTPVPKVEMDQKIPEQVKEEMIAEETTKTEIQPPVLEEIPEEIKLTKQEEKMIKKHVKKTEKLKKEYEKEPTPEKEYELKLHESLLPVSDEKDKELIKAYFTKIFTVLSKDVKNQIKNLKISKKEKNELLQEFAFLTRDEQVKYIEAIINMYQEIPKKLIDRIRKLPNVQPKHYDKIIDQLKYLDFDEQLRFIQFLEENA